MGNCLIQAAALLLGCEYDQLIKRLGHDGTAQVFPGNGQRSQIGFHREELTYVAWKYYDTALVPYEKHPELSPGPDVPMHPVYTCEGAKERFWNLLIETRGILILDLGHIFHAVMYDSVSVHDPRGFKMSLTQCFDDVTIALVALRIESTEK